MSDGTRTIEVNGRSVKTTNDYGIFKIMHGNRNVDLNHVKELQRLLVDNGNLTQQFPIVVNKEMEIIDGQHRLEALRGLGWDIAYIIEDGATINMVRAINLGNKNWNWKDIAESYANLGSHEYRWFLDYCAKYNLGFSIAMRFCDLAASRRSGTSVYYQGYLVIEDKPKAVAMAEHFREAMQHVEDGMSPRDFAHALHKIRQSPAYDDKRMIQKLKERGYQLPIKAAMLDFTRQLEDIFNSGYSEENKVRLF